MVVTLLPSFFYSSFFVSFITHHLIKRWSQILCECLFLMRLPHRSKNAYLNHWLWFIYWNNLIRPSFSPFTRLDAITATQTFNGDIILAPHSHFAFALAFVYFLFSATLSFYGNWTERGPVHLSLSLDTFPTLVPLYLWYAILLYAVLCWFGSVVHCPKAHWLK